jgi:hypothetical protein
MNAAIAAVCKVITSLPAAMSPNDARKAYEHAEEFFGAMAEASIAEDELSETDEDLIDRPYWSHRREAAYGKACVAASRMPALWLSIFGVKIEATRGIAAPTAAAV